MKTNMGTLDRCIRVTFAALVAGLYAARLLNGTTAMILGALGAIFVFTSMVGVCPLYLPLKISTKSGPQ